MTITFHNKSSLPIEFVQTFGVSAKENEHPIGYFGTGLKYAIAVLLREGCSVSIEIDDNIYQFFKRKQTLRNKEFEFIYMDEHMLAFTTELGKNWQLWQAYRELYSNCMDEKGEVFGYAFMPGGDGTTVVVDGAAFDAIHEQRGEFILLSKPRHSLEELEIHDSDTPGIFYKGIRVLTLPTKFSYNILSDLTLTEDRTASQWDVEYAITKALTTTDDLDAIADVITLAEDSGFHEPKLAYSKYVSPSQGFLTIISKLKKPPHNAATYYGHYRDDYVGGLPKESLSAALKKKLRQIQSLMKFRPKEVYVMKIDNDDFKIVKDELCLSMNLMNQPKKLAFVYLLACHMMSGKDKNRDRYKVITEDMLQYFTPPKNLDLKNGSRVEFKDSDEGKFKGAA